MIRIDCPDNVAPTADVDSATIALVGASPVLTELPGVRMLRPAVRASDAVQLVPEGLKFGDAYESPYFETVDRIQEDQAGVHLAVDRRALQLDGLRTNRNRLSVVAHFVRSCLSWWRA